MRYARVSTSDQSPPLQTDALVAAASRQVSVDTGRIHAGGEHRIPLRRQGLASV